MAEPVFKDINAEDSDNGITEIESLCMQCHENVIRNNMILKQISGFICRNVFISVLCTI